MAFENVEKRIKNNTKKVKEAVLNSNLNKGSKTNKKKVTIKIKKK